jgi:hypothetical protein
VAVPLVFGLSGKAEATAYASSVLQVDDASFSGPGFSGSFDSFLFILRGLSVTLNAASDSTAQITKTAAGSSLNQPVTCLDGGSGTCATFVDNVLFPSTDNSNALGSYAVADSHELNTAISAGTAFWGSLGQAQLTGSFNAAASTGTNNTLQWDFTSPGGTVTFEGDLTQNFEVFLNASGTNATATANLTVQIQQDGKTIAGGTLFDLASFRPDCVNTTIISSTGNAHPCADETNTIGGTSAALDAGEVYSLLIRFDTSADVLQAAVPEPASLVLMGISLVAVGIVTRRRLQK